MKYSVDRIEEGFAVCEDENGNFVDIETDKLPLGLKEGDIFSLENGVAVILEEETIARKKALAEKRKAIFKKRSR